MLDIGKFKNLNSEYRSAPFWSLNDEMDENELVRQVHEMYEQGMGGFFMHPRGGMKDEYLGEKYMNAMEICVREAEKLGMKAWLYDEDRFASGGAGGLAVKGRPEFRQKALLLKKADLGDISRNAGTVAIFRIAEEECSGTKYFDISGLSDDKIRKMVGKALVFEVIYMPETLMWNNNSYTDLCYKEAVEAFINVTHENYRDRLYRYFGNTIPGVFTDEPNFNVEAWNEKVMRLPWTFEFEKEFLRQKNYDLMGRLPELFFKAGDYRKTRFDYWDVISGLFVRSFSETVYNWCEKYRLKFTGHYWEHGFPSPVHTGSTMPNYEFMHYPGIDMLFNTKEERNQVGNELIVKEVSSVGNQLGKERILSETYGASGWELSFKDQKRIADWQFALGINLVCQHLVHYSLKGYRKRDFPLSFMDHQPWWKCYGKLGDYIGRMSYVLSQGEFVGDILVLHPSSSTWAEFSVVGDDNESERLEESAKWLNKALCELHFFYDLGDEILIERHGKVSGNLFTIGRSVYSTVILPNMTVIRESTFRLLKEFAENGGRIIATGSTPYLLEGSENSELRDFFDNGPVVRPSADKKLLKNALDAFDNQKAVVDGINGADTSRVYCHKRVCVNKLMYFLCNTDKQQKVDIRLGIDGACRVEEWDAFTGEIRELDVFEKNGSDDFFVELELNPVESHLLVVDLKEEARIKSPAVMKNCPETTIKLDRWHVMRNNYNALTLKLCQYAAGGGEWSPLQDVLDADGKLSGELGFEYRSQFTRQPWMYEKELKERKFTVSVKYNFTVLDELCGEIYAAVEETEVFEVYVNGKKAARTGKYHLDRAFVMYDIKDSVKCGENEVLLVTDRFTIISSIESIYIVGDFIVENTGRSFALEREKDPIEPGDWTKAGYPYYSGAMQYKTGFDAENTVSRKYELVLDKLWMIAARVLVNGQDAGILGWEPYKADITEFIIEGKNELSIEVMNSLQNLLGSHNDKETPGLCTPGSFFYSDGDVRFVESGFNGVGRIDVFLK